MLARTEGPQFETFADVRLRLQDEIYEITNGIVQAGPFKGMQIYPDSGWPERNIVAELLGFFELELHSDIEREIARLQTRPEAKIVNVGCAEGYYAVGLGRRLPRASMYVVEPDERSLLIAKKNGENNGVKLLIVPVDQLFDRVDLVVMDCEGAETDYLDPDEFPGLRNAVIIVELHPVRERPNPFETLYRRFNLTHDSKLVGEGARNPNASELLWRKSSMERWIAVCESRPCMMAWMVLRPRGRKA